MQLHMLVCSSLLCLSSSQEFRSACYKCLDILLTWFPECDSGVLGPLLRRVLVVASCWRGPDNNHFSLHWENCIEHILISTSGSDGLHLLEHLTELQQVCPVSGLGLGLVMDWVLLVTGGPRGQSVCVTSPLRLLGDPHLLRSTGRESRQCAV